MKRIALGSAIAFVAATVSLPSSAGFYTGNDIYDRCTDSLQTATSICLGYVAGTVDMMMLDYSALICVPAGADLRQVTDTVIKDLRDNPGSRHQSAALLIFVTLTTVWPCPKP